ncbi:restriction endonuclease [Enterobacter cloacae]|uniref:restriction endonuclease n=1 Tax=Enterobacter cloacae TaxID=550 RepID=UPI0037543E90
MTKNTGKSYEKFVQTIQQTLLNADKFISGRTVVVELDKKLVNNSGVSRQFDVYFEFEAGGHLYRTVIECKDYASAIKAEKIDAFLGKTAGIPGLNLIYATRTGYQSGAVAIAGANNVRLLVIDEAGDEDWIDEDGTPFIRTVHIKGLIISPPSIISFYSETSGSHLTEAELAEAELLLNTFPPAWHIEDKDTGEQYDMLQLQHKLHQLYPDIVPGKGKHAQKLNNAWIVMKDGSLRVKLLQYEVEFRKSPNVEMELTVDVSEQLLGIVTDITQGKKMRIWKPDVNQDK